MGLGAAALQHRGALAAGVIGSLTLGLAPYVPHPHIYKQLVNLFTGRLSEAIDVFDLVLHGAPWLYLAITLVRVWQTSREQRRLAGEAHSGGGVPPPLNLP